MNSSVFSRFSATLSASTTRTTYTRLALARFYATKKGKKAKSPNVAIDHDLAEGLVDLEKLKASMQKTVDSLQLEFQDKLSVKIQPNVLDKLKVQSQNGKEMFPLSQVAEIKLNDSMFVIDLRDSPELVSQAAQAIKSWNTNLEPTLDGPLISIPIPKVTQEYRENLVKVAKSTCEQYKQSLRKTRQKGMSDIRKNKKGKSQDDAKTVEKMVEQLTDQFCNDTDILLEEKTKELLRK